MNILEKNIISTKLTNYDLYTDTKTTAALKKSCRRYLQLPMERGVYQVVYCFSKINNMHLKRNILKKIEIESQQ